MSEVKDNWIKPELKSEMENLAGFLHPLSEADREVFREGFRSALATTNYYSLAAELEAVKKERDELNKQLIKLCTVKDETVKDCIHNWNMFSEERVKLTEALKALEFYGDKSHWKELSSKEGHEGFAARFSLTSDHGNLARETLQKLGGK